LKTVPRGRSFLLDHRDGVKSWVVRLTHEEAGLCVKDIRFLGDEEEEESGAEEAREDRKEGKEEEEEESEADHPVTKNGRKKGKWRKGRQKGKGTAKGKGTRGAKKTSKPKMDEVQVKLNGSAAKENEDTKGEWNLELPVGPNIVEIGEKGGLVWKVFAERVPNTHFV
jgi:chromatin structure-remodeling complex subunit RSC4